MLKREIRIMDLIYFESQMPPRFWPLNNNAVGNILIPFLPGLENNSSRPCRTNNGNQFDSGELCRPYQSRADPARNVVVWTDFSQC